MRLILLSLLLTSSLAGLAQTIGKTYTFDAIDQQVQGKVIVSFVLDRQGRLLPDSTRVLKGLGHGLDELAVQAVNEQQVAAGSVAMARRSAQPARFAVPIVFALTALTPRDWSDYYTLKGDRAMAEAKAERAVSYYDLALGRYKRNGAACAGLGRAYTSLGKTTEAAKYNELAAKYAAVSAR